MKLGIDRGSSFTDFVIEDNQIIIEKRSLSTRDLTTIFNEIKQIWKQFPDISQTYYAGPFPKCDFLEKHKLFRTDELTSVGRGAVRLSGLDEAIIVSFGTGTAIVHANNNVFRHLGGTGVGGGTIKGLSKLLLNTDNMEQIESLALSGDEKQINLILADLGYKNIGLLHKDVTASNFAKIADTKKENIAAGILSLVGETVSVIASLCAQSCELSSKIVVVGKPASNKFLQKEFKKVGSLYNTKFVVPEHNDVATAFGSIEFD